MSQIIAVFKKEVRIYINSPIAYLFLIVFLTLGSWIFFRTFYFYNKADLKEFFNILPWIYLFLIPSLTMRLISEEKKEGTIETLLTLPLKDHQIIIGKFLASFFFLALALVLTFLLPLIVAILGDPDGGVIFAAYLGALCLGTTFLSIGFWTSSLSKNQIVAFVGAAFICFVLLIVGNTFVTFSAPDLIRPVFEYLGILNHYSSISRGVLDSRDIIYFLSLILIFLYLSIISLGRRNWKS